MDLSKLPWPLWPKNPVLLVLFPLFMMVEPTLHCDFMWEWVKTFCPNILWMNIHLPIFTIYIGFIRLPGFWPIPMLIYSDVPILWCFNSTLHDDQIRIQPRFFDLNSTFYHKNPNFCFLMMLKFMYGGFHKWSYPKMVGSQWFIMENPNLTWMITGVPSGKQTGRYWKWPSRNSWFTHYIIAWWFSSSFFGTLYQAENTSILGQPHISWCTKITSHQVGALGAVFGLLVQWCTGGATPRRNIIMVF